MRRFLACLALLVPAAAHAESGEAIFTANCAVCHQADGGGAAGVAPALAGTLAGYTSTPAGKQYLSQILISGMVGSIQTQGHKFSGLMPSFADKLTDAQADAVLGYVLAKFNGVTVKVVTAKDVAAARASNPSSNDTHHLRKTLLATQ
jgi:mono/diheme cytochrome c family protein